MVKDFHARSLQMPLESIIIQQSPNSTDLLVKFASSDANEVIIGLAELWPDLGTKKPFNYEFLDQQYASYYESELRFSQLLYVFLRVGHFL